MQAFAADDVPDFDGGVGVARHEDVVAQLHARRQRLVAHQRVLARTRFGVPHADARVQRAAHHVDPVKLLRRGTKMNVTTSSSNETDKRQHTLIDFRSTGAKLKWQFPSGHLEGVDAIGVSLQRVKALLAFGVPHFDRVVVGTADDEPAVVLDAADGGHVADQHVQALARVHVPNAQRRVARTAHHPAPQRPKTSC